MEARNLPHWRCDTKSIGKSWFKINRRPSGTLEKSCRQKSLLGREHDETLLYCYNCRGCFTYILLPGPKITFIPLQGFLPLHRQAIALQRSPRKTRERKIIHEYISVTLAGMGMLGMLRMRGCAGDHFELEMRSNDGRTWNSMSGYLESDLEGMQVLLHNNQVRQREMFEHKSDRGFRLSHMIQ
jgi:hypothetical protein